MPPETGGNSFNVSATGGGSHEKSMAENNVEVYGRSLSYVLIDAFYRERGSTMEVVLYLHHTNVLLKHFLLVAQPVSERPSPHPDADASRDQHRTITSTSVCKAVLLNPTPG